MVPCAEVSLERRWITVLAPMVMGWMPVTATPPESRDEGWAVRGGLGAGLEVEVGGLGRDIGYVRSEVGI